MPPVQKTLNFRTRGRLIRAAYYTAIIEDQDRFSPIRPLVDWLDYNGFTVVTKPAKSYVDPAGNRRTRGDMDVDLAVDYARVTVYYPRGFVDSTASLALVG